MNITTVATHSRMEVHSSRAVLSLTPSISVTSNYRDKIGDTDDNEKVKDSSRTGQIKSSHHEQQRAVKLTSSEVVWRLSRRLQTTTTTDGAQQKPVKINRPRMVICYDQKSLWNVLLAGRLTSLSTTATIPSDCHSLASWFSKLATYIRITFHSEQLDSCIIVSHVYYPHHRFIITSHRKTSLITGLYIFHLNNGPSLSNRHENHSNVRHSHQSPITTVGSSNKKIIDSPQISSTHSPTTCAKHPMHMPTIGTSSWRINLYLTFWLVSLSLLLTNTKAYHIRTQQNRRGKVMPDLAELAVPDYMHQLHQRHRQNWQDFEQFDENHMIYPTHVIRPEIRVTMGKLGAVTAIRHHEHIDTHDKHTNVSSNQNSAFKSSRSHRLTFRLADLPEDEVLLAASVRIRYVPVKRPKHYARKFWRRCNVPSKTTRQWPVVVGLDYASSSDMEMQALGTFEPDHRICAESRHMFSNQTLIHLPRGWFNIPLNKEMLSVLLHTNKHSTYRNVSIHVNSIFSNLYGGREMSKRLGLWPIWQGQRPDVYDAPHLLTFHRDRNIKYEKRERRSIGLNGDQAMVYVQHEKPEIELGIPRTEVNKLHRRYRRSASTKWQDDQSTYRSKMVPTSISYSQAQTNTQDGISRQRRQYNYPTPQTQPGETFIHPPGYLENTCKPRDLIVDFAAVGWSSWVIAPRSYNARYCFGQCPFPLSTHYNTSNHAVLLQLVHLLNAAQIPGPCCVPHELSSMSLLYRTSKNDIVLQNYDNMVVESCACR